jgi:hypothetical protein
MEEPPSGRPGWTRLRFSREKGREGRFPVRLLLLFGANVGTSE